MRSGPYEKFPFGDYKGRLIESVIDMDPYYFMVAVKRWLNVSPKQAQHFERVSNGGEIPEEYIKDSLPSEEVMDRDFNRSFQQILDEEYVDFDNQVWRSRKTGEILYQN